MPDGHKRGPRVFCVGRCLKCWRPLTLMLKGWPFNQHADHPAPAQRSADNCTTHAPGWITLLTNNQPHFTLLDHQSLEDMVNIFPYSLVYCCFLHLGPGWEEGRRDPCSSCRFSHSLLLLMRASELRDQQCPSNSLQRSIKEETRGKWRQTKGINAKYRPSLPRGAGWRCKNNDKYRKRSEPSN